MSMEKLSLYSHRRALVALFAVAAIGLSGLAVAEADAEKESPKPKTSSPELIVLKFHADWCGSCRTMGPIVEDLQNKMDGDPVLFLTLDLTNRSTRMQAEYLVDSLGLSDAWVGHGGGKATGFLLAVDAETHQPVGVFKKNHTMKQMAAALSESIAAKSDTKS